MGKIKTWSFSRLNTYYDCPMKAYFEYVEKVQYEKHPAMLRGSEIHEEMEAYLRGERADVDMDTKFPLSTKKFEPFRKATEDGLTAIEEDWAFNSNWEPTGWVADDCWLRVKLDLLVKYEEQKHMHIIDWKTGKKFGKEATHTSQGQLYAIAAFIMYPEMQTAQVEFWYLDQKGTPTLGRPYTRAQIELYLERTKARAQVMLEDEIFKPKANIYNCRFCDFGPGKLDHCEFGVSAEN